MEKLHHANIIIGEDHKRFVSEILKKLNFNPQSNPDFLILESESFGIDDARNLEKWSSLKPFLSEIKVSHLVTKTITHEAQNALLKVLEEPPVGTYFFISIENLGGLLPTFLSRVRILNTTSVRTIDESENTLKFLRSDIKAKFALIRSVSKKEDKSKIKNILKNLEIAAYQDTKNSLKETEELKKILTAKIFASARGSSPKMLLEWLSCVL
jgi:DNA polymerase III subunit delta'